MGSVTEDTDTECLTPNADADGNSVRAPPKSGLVDEDCRAARASTVSPRRRFAIITASVALLALFLVVSAGFCFCTVMRLRSIEARLERLEIIGRHASSYVIGKPNYSAAHFVRPHSVRNLVVVIL